MLASLALAFLLATSARGQQPFYEETFNDGGASLKLYNEAAIGAAGSGVSGKPGDAAYEAAAAEPGVRAPVATIISELPADSLQEFTMTVWFKPGADISGKLASLFNSHGIVLGWDGGQWLLRVNDRNGEKAAEKYYKAGTGIDAAPGDWKFLACTWSNAAKEAAFFVGDKTRAVEQETSVASKDPQPEMSFGDPKIPKAVGNTFVPAAAESFPGHIDDIRMFDKVLTVGQIEKIRQADLENKAIYLK
ncbi:MAG: LamG-like jellyroll fold domain-containing protein [Verrucomicrobiae bacterium]